MEIAKVKKMKRHYLPFEKPLKDLDFEIERLTTSESDSKQLKDLIVERENLEKEIFADLSPWETVQLARHPNRPYTLDYINALGAIISQNCMEIKLFQMTTLLLQELESLKE